MRKQHVRAWARRRRLDLVCCVGLMLASLVFTVEQVTEHEQLSPIDEFQYVDYYAKVLDQGVVRQGERSEIFARRQSVCRGVRAVAWPVSEENCKARDAGGEIFPLGGGTTGDIYTPLYFLPTRVAAQPLVWAGVDFVDAGRMVGGLWLGAGAIVLYSGLRRWRVSRHVAVAAGLLMIGSLPAYWSNTYLSTDASALLAGSTMLLLATGARQRQRLALRLLPVAAVVVTLLKLQNFVAVVAAATFLILVAAFDAFGDRSGRRRGHGWRTWLLDPRTLAAVAAGVAGILAQLAWLYVRSRLSLGPTPDDGAGGPFQWPYLLGDSTVFLRATQAGAMPTAVTGKWSDVMYLITLIATFGGTIGLLLSRHVRAHERLLALSVVLVGIAAGPALTFAIAVTEDESIALPARYGTSLLPWMLACSAVLLDSESRAARWSAAAFGATAFAVALALGEGA